MFKCSSLISIISSGANYIVVQSRANDIVRLLVDSGVDSNILNKDGITPLYLAAKKGVLKYNILRI